MLTPSVRSGPRHLLELVGACLIVGGLLAAPAQADDSEMQVQFISKIARYVDWPDAAFASDDAKIRVAVLGDNPYGGQLSSVLSTTSAKGRSFEVQEIAEVADAGGFHVLIVTEENSRAAKKIARELKGIAVLSIGRARRFAEDGGIIGMEMYKGKVAFDVNNRSAKKAKLKISSRLLQVATNVY